MVVSDSENPIINALENRFYNDNKDWTYAPVSLRAQNGSVINTQNGITAPAIDCSNLTHQALLGAGYNVNYHATADLISFIHGNASSEYNVIAIAQNNRVIDRSHVQIGDLVVFEGHVGIIKTFDSTRGIGTFDGSQSSTGPNIDVPFYFEPDIQSKQYWGGTEEFRDSRGNLLTPKPIIGILRVKDSTYNPDAAAAKLFDLNIKINAALKAADIDSYFSDIRIEIANNQGSTSPYHVLKHEYIQRLADDTHLSITQLFSIAGNENWQDRKIIGSNGGDIYLVKQGNKLYVTPEDNDFFKLKYATYDADADNPEGGAVVTFNDRGQAIINKPSDVYRDYLEKTGNEQSFFQVTGQRLAGWLSDAGVSVKSFTDEIASIITNTDESILQRTFNSFSYTGDFINNRMQQIFGESAHIGFGFGKGFDRLDANQYFEQREITQQDIQLQGSFLIGESDTAKVSGYTSLGGGSGFMVNFSLTDLMNLVDGIVHVVKGIFNGIQNLVSPLVLDLDKDGIELSQAYEQKVFFDIDNDEYLEKVGWTKPDDGYRKGMFRYCSCA